MLSAKLKGFTDEEASVIVEAAYYAMRSHYEDLAEHLDMSDEFLVPIVEKFVLALEH
jgi:hypothetical protein